MFSFIVVVSIIIMFFCMCRFSLSMLPTSSSILSVGDGQSRRQAAPLLWRALQVQDEVSQRPGARKLG